jgi:hypothetical protein
MQRAALLVFFDKGRVRLIRYSEEREVRKTLAEYESAAKAGALAGK